MTDRKKNASRTQTATMKAGNQEAVQSEKSVKATASESTKTAKASVRGERKDKQTAARRGGKKSGGFFSRLRNGAIGRFIYDAYYELRYKVTWPTPKEARNMTILVVILSLVVGGFIALADFGLHQLFLLLIGVR